MSAAIMKIQDVFAVDKRGVVIGGTNSDFDRLSPDEVRRKIGTEIEIRNLNGAISKVPVIEVEVSNSLLGQKNIFILLPAETAPTAFQVGATVYDLPLSK